MMIDPRDRPAMQLKEAAQILGISEVTAYETAKRYLATGDGRGYPLSVSGPGG
ncbi:MAG: hypothetical protein LC808_03150 [Actinobacteria bacterium]|nr:hypothetical protein [Actinomycetota bacterium]